MIQDQKFDRDEVYGKFDGFRQGDEFGYVGDKLPEMQKMMISFRPGNEDEDLVGDRDASSESVSPFPYSALSTSFTLNDYYTNYENNLLEVHQEDNGDSLENPTASWNWDFINEQNQQLNENLQLEGLDYYDELERYYTMSGQEVLCNIFTMINKDNLKAILSHANYNLEVGLELALDYSSNPQRNISNILNTTRPSNKMPLCRYFMLGNCLRYDCKYSHDPENLVCRFWLQGECLKGKFCEFMHGPEIASATATLVKKLAPDLKVENINSKASFPPLSPYSTLITKQVPQSSKKTSVANPPSLNDNEAFPKLGAENLSGHWASRKSQIQTKKVTTPLSFSDVIKTSVPTAPPQLPHSIPTLPLQKKHDVTHSSRKSYAKWLDTGSRVASTYMKYRSTAIERAIQRNKLLQRAAEAYSTGNKAAARAFSLGAHRLNEELSELHLIAARNIFNERNKSLFDDIRLEYPNFDYSTLKYSNAHILTDRIVDLHGLHPSEATFLLKDVIEKFSSFLKSYVLSFGRSLTDNGKFRLTVITGTGHHSRNQKAKILPAIEEWIRTSNLDAHSCAMQDGRGGAFIIELK